MPANQIFANSTGFLISDWVKQVIIKLNAYEEEQENRFACLTKVENFLKLGLPLVTRDEELLTKIKTIILSVAEVDEQVLDFISSHITNALILLDSQEQELLFKGESFLYIIDVFIDRISNPERPLLRFVMKDLYFNYHLFSINYTWERIRLIKNYYNNKYRIDIKLMLEMTGENLFKEIDKAIASYRNQEDKSEKKFAFLSNYSGHAFALVLICIKESNTLLIFDTKGFTEETINSSSRFDVKAHMKNKLEQMQDNLPLQEYDKLIFSFLRDTGAFITIFQSYIPYYLCAKKRGMDIYFNNGIIQADNESCWRITFSCLKQILIKDALFSRDHFKLDTYYSACLEDYISIYSIPEYIKYSQRSDYDNNLISTFPEKNLQKSRIVKCSFFNSRSNYTKTYSLDIHVNGKEERHYNLIRKHEDSSVNENTGKTMYSMV